MPATPRRLLLGAGAAIALCLAIASLLLLRSFYEKGASYRDLLRDADSVTISEYRVRTGDGTYQDLLVRKTLDRAQAQALSRCFSGMSLLTRASYCHFEPHHEIICTMPDGSIHHIHLCFKCQQAAIDSGTPIDMSPWVPALSHELAALGLPVKLDEYQFHK
jgi:hypothetical protein